MPLPVPRVVDTVICEVEGKSLGTANTKSLPDQTTKQSHQSKLIVEQKETTR